MNKDDSGERNYLFVNIEKGKGKGKKCLTR